MKKTIAIHAVVSIMFVWVACPASVSAAAILDDDSRFLQVNETGHTDVQYDDSKVNGGIRLVEDLYADQQVDKQSFQRAARKSKELRISFQTQQNNYYCGPASAAMIVNALGYKRNQNEMARLLGTTQAGTNAGNGVSNALNAVVKGSRYKFRWEWQSAHQVDKIKRHVTQAIDYGNAVMVNTVEGPRDWYIQGHNLGYTIYHYGVVADYFDYGNTVTYVDPGHGRFSGFKLQQRVSIKNLSYACGTRGYAW